MDTCNPYPERDGEAAHEVLKSGQGTGLWTAKQLPGARIVRAFNSVHAEVFESEARREGDKIGVPLAGDDQQSLKVVAKLVQEAGFSPIIVGGLKEAKRFDVGTAPYASDLPEKQLRKRLGESGPIAA
jgi:predicted dinucleotide-binding enzyme